MNTPRPRGRWWLVAALALVALPSAPTPIAAQEATPKPPTREYRVVFSARLFTEVSENDAKAAVVAWAGAVARERNIAAVPDAQVADGLPALARVMKAGECDLLGLTTIEYLSLGLSASSDSLIVGTTGTGPFIEYVLLVHHDAGIADLAGLKGRNVTIYDNALTCLASPWLDTILMEKGLPPTDRHFARVSNAKKLSAVVLPVFFRQSDACLVTRGGLETLAELNPEVGKQLTILATSPGYLPSLTVRLPRKGASPGLGDMWEEIKLTHLTPSGRQVLNLFKVDRIVGVPPSALNTALELLANHRRLLAKWQAGGAVPRAGRGASHAAPAAEASAATAGRGGQ